MIRVFIRGCNDEKLTLSVDVIELLFQQHINI